MPLLTRAETDPMDGARAALRNKGRLLVADSMGGDARLPA